MRSEYAGISRARDAVELRERAMNPPVPRLVSDSTLRQYRELRLREKEEMMGWPYDPSVGFVLPSLQRHCPIWLLRRALPQVGSAQASQLSPDVSHRGEI